jgi:shikimate dehydrogenase
MSETVGLLGWPVAHSVSPAMHNAAFDALGLDWRYQLLPAPPEELAAAVAEVAAKWRGANVTVPYKQAVLDLPHIAEADPAAREIGAANTLIARRDGRLVAVNTDWQGLRDDLHAQGVDPAGGPCLILGSGGSARAAAYALGQMGAARVEMVSRRPKGRTDTLSYDQLAGRRAALVVNCTPLGMAPQVGKSAWPEGVPLPEGAVVYDLVYNPADTALMQRARAEGLRAIGGLGMLARQGALSFERWTGIAPPLEIMLHAAQTALEATC